VDYLKRSGGIFRDMLIHDFDILPLDLEDRRGDDLRDGQRPHRPRPSAASEDPRRFDRGHHSHRRDRAGLVQINTSRRAA
jgi:myo-inositol 2-dehydrogenase/D-chiro-inositol 1-dehydrogenase